MYKTRDTNKLKILLKLDKRIFSLDDLATLWEVENRNTLTTTVRRYKDRGILFPLKKGLYSVLPVEKLNPYEIGCSLCGSFSYISTETVLANDGIIMQGLSAISLVGQRKMDFIMGDNRFICRYLNPKFLINRAGINDNLRYSIATTERAIADMMFFNPKYYFDNDLAVTKMDINKLQKEINYR